MKQRRSQSKRVGVYYRFYFPRDFGPNFINMTILYDYQAFVQKIGGVSRYHFELIRHLPEGIQANLQPLLSDNVYLRQMSRRQYSFRSNWDNKNKENVYKAVDQGLSFLTLASKKFDVFHVTGLNPYYIGHAKGKPIVMTVHDLIHEKCDLHDSDVVKAKRKKCLAVADAIICVSEETKRDLLSYYDVDEGKTSVIYHGADQDLIAPDVASLVEAPYLLYIGGRNSYKNFPNFLRAFARLDKDMRLVCTGAPFNSEERELISSLGIGDRIIQRFVTDDELNNLLCHALAFVYPSKMEGFGIPILEAYRAGCPAIISDIQCFHEVAADAAEYFDPNDVDSIAERIGSTVSNSDRLAELKQSGYDRLKFFTWDETANKTAAVYKSLI